MTPVVESHKKMISSQYFETLRYAMSSAQARTFAVERLESSLKRIHLHRNCVRDVIATLNSLLNQGTLNEFITVINKFRSTWRTHLGRAYFMDYESLRWQYFHRTVISKLNCNLGGLGLVLDVGCGRGCLTSQIVANGMAKAAVGIDAVQFDSEWNERKAAVQSGLSFEHVDVARFDEWLSSRQSFDTIILSYVLHHSEGFWAAWTVRSALKRLNSAGRCVILEDSFGAGRASEDPFGLAGRWCELAASSDAYGTTAAFDVQVVLDFVAVQLLAQFDEVSMPCNYRRMDEWERLFQAIGGKVEHSEFLGFPPDRDIDVPQALFVLSQTQA